MNSFYSDERESQECNARNSFIYFSNGGISHSACGTQQLIAQRPLHVSSGDEAPVEHHAESRAASSRCSMRVLLGLW